MLKITSLPVLKRVVAQVIKGEFNEGRFSLPILFEFSEGIGDPTYEVTITEKLSEWFIDKNGYKWVRTEQVGEDKP